MGVPPPANNGANPSSPHSSPSAKAPNSDDTHKHKKSHDPNMDNPRLLVNRACIYERQLPGDTYITAHVSRLQHGFWDSPAVSDTYAEHVDFLALSFVFHSAHTLSHRFKSATVRVSVESSSENSKPTSINGCPSGNPCFLMHAPHLIYGAVSPETMEWSFSLAGSLGVSETPVSASIIPSGSLNGQYRRYEMMRIQGSSRTMKSPKGPDFDVEAGEVVWSLEENSLQRSGLPREFTFVMLIQKPAANSKIKLSLEIDPVIQAFWGSFPGWMIRLSPYQPLERRSVDFRREVGQHFQPADPQRGFNFAVLESAFDHYIAMPGRKYTRRLELPAETQLPHFSSGQQGYPGQYGNLGSSQQQGTSLTNTLLQNQLRQLSTNSGNQEPAASAPVSASANTALVGTMAVPISIPSAQSTTNTYNVRLGLDPTLIQQLATLHASPSTHQNRVYGTEAPYQMTSACKARAENYSSRHAHANSSSTDVGWWLYDDGAEGNPEWSSPLLNADIGLKSYENVREGMLRTVHPMSRGDRSGLIEDRHRVMNLRNQPLTSGLLSSLSEDED
ncbi:hypothetical protein N7448_008412 [Penicillium atrosanguineum]|uniref:Uncharacterized protein n=1 Tax=Penicillium atrosanguineum TaxID=1132637 RepID=A0A9W9GR40_9EURO|nr:uncharacterized protein N7443_000571 [Penicillium atrosanguineum]KAJ5127633.1 hypothetical protein N7448_008412 [Penicillium atrosanguineum]KAJ5147842.1 hypothetical protein N7526_001194 [Penicillium atrosanguineum]KAJ5313687.1 hypothetical protein N7443_000571 [Penicillium atrosanguineum]KAJ5330859.1 hypothetical protein N7476_000642 [Penicillium atrosanguineum]